MKYELAKQLKDAGFPMEEAQGLFMVKEPQDDSEEWFELGLGEVYWKPTLSELIEACGDLFQVLWKRSDGWITKCWSGGDDKMFNFHEALGSTPEEAVAKLWLAINKK